MDHIDPDKKVFCRLGADCRCRFFGDCPNGLTAHEYLADLELIAHQPAAQPEDKS